MNPPPLPKARVLLIGNLENRRAAFLRAACASLHLPPPIELSYDAILHQRADLSPLTKPHPNLPTIVRFDSPGENFRVTRALIARGADLPDPDNVLQTHHRIPKHTALQLQPDRGLILAPRQWYLGYIDLLRTLHARLHPSFHVMNPVDDIATMFDKTRTHTHLLNHNVPVPPSIPNITSYDQLLEEMQRTNTSRVFIKIINGSSASGVLALRVSKHRSLAVTSAERVQTNTTTRLYNSLRLSRYTRHEEIADVVQTLASIGGLHVEAWVPKMQLHGQRFDLRIVTIQQHPSHTVMRTGPSPMTNLHLGNQRGDLDALRARLSPEAWQRALDTCSAAAHTFPNSLYCGVDLLLSTRNAQPYIGELNAYGDLLPRITHNGMDTYTGELHAALTQLPPQRTS